MKEKTLLFGFGAVGQGFYSYLKKNERADEVQKIVVKNPDKERPEAIQDKILYECPDLADFSTIVEVSSDAAAGLRIIEAGLKAGKKVITSSKKVVAEHLPQLVALANQHQASFCYEATTAASIPILTNLQHYYKDAQLQSIEGILNGTSNYLLTRLQEEDCSFEKVLKEAQNKNYAEEDASSDLAGWDAVYKLSILIYHAFQVHLPPEKIPTFGIQDIHPIYLKWINEQGYRVKPMAKAVAGPKNIEAYQFPQAIPPENPIFQANHQYNAVLLKDENFGSQMLLGEGAGTFPTGYAVFRDYQLKQGYQLQAGKRQLENLGKDMGFWVFAAQKESLGKMANTAEEISIKGKTFFVADIKSNLIDLQKKLAENTWTCAKPTE